MAAVHAVNHKVIIRIAETLLDCWHIVRLGTPIRILVFYHPGTSFVVGDADQSVQ